MPDEARTAYERQSPRPSSVRRGPALPRGEPGVDRLEPKADVATEANVRHTTSAPLAVDPVGRHPDVPSDVVRFDSRLGARRSSGPASSGSDIALMTLFADMIPAAELR